MNQTHCQPDEAHGGEKDGHACRCALAEIDNFNEVGRNIDKKLAQVK